MLGFYQQHRQNMQCDKLPAPCHKGYSEAADNRMCSGKFSEIDDGGVGANFHVTRYLLLKLHQFESCSVYIVDSGPTNLGVGSDLVV